jgi:hypothetical protein
MEENDRVPDKAEILASWEMARQEFYAMLDQVPASQWDRKVPAISLFSVGALLVHTSETMRWALQALPELRQGKNFMAIPHSQVEDFKIRSSHEEASRATPQSLHDKFEADYQAAVAALESVKPEEWRQGGTFLDEGFYTVEKLLASRLAHVQEHAVTLGQLLGKLRKGPDDPEGSDTR